MFVQSENALSNRFVFRYVLNEMKQSVACLTSGSSGAGLLPMEPMLLDVPGTLSQAAGKTSGRSPTGSEQRSWVSGASIARWDGGPSMTATSFRGR